jgi:ABC-type dipeptide/oligopeptide/nickel transport system permease subunit
VHNIILGLAVVFFIFPWLIILTFSNILLGQSVYTNLIVIGFLSTFSFTGIIANAIRRESGYLNVLKVIIKYIPFVMASGIMLYLMVGYLGLGDENTANLGITFVYGRSSWGATWAVFMPGQVMFGIMLSLLFLHEGLKAPTIHREEPIESVISS